MKIFFAEERKKSDVNIHQFSTVLFEMNDIPTNCPARLIHSGFPLRRNFEIKKMRFGLILLNYVTFSIGKKCNFLFRLLICWAWNSGIVMKMSSCVNNENDFMSSLWRDIWSTIWLHILREIIILNMCWNIS